MMAPFTPFICETMYQNLRLYQNLPAGVDDRSVHFQMIPEVDESFFDDVIELKVERMQKVIELGRYIREKKNLPLKVYVINPRRR